MISLDKFYRVIDEESKECSDRLQLYIELAKSANVPEEEYEDYSLYKKLIEERKKYQFLKNKIMKYMR